MSNTMTADEHMRECKRRALKILDSGDIMEAVTSMMSDLSKHPGTKHHTGIELGLMLMVADLLNTEAEARRFIVGFH